jgi:hypothetical protein
MPERSLWNVKTRETLMLRYLLALVYGDYIKPI